MWVFILIGIVITCLIIFLVVLPLTCVYNLYGLERCNVVKSPCGQGKFVDGKCICNDGWTGKFCQINKNLETAECTEPNAFKVYYTVGSPPVCMSKLDVCPCPEASCLPHGDAFYAIKQNEQNYCMHDAFDGEYFDSTGVKIKIENGDLIYDGQNLGKNTFMMYTDTKDQCETIRKNFSCN